MADLKSLFEAAVANSKNLSERPDNATLLKIYALYKQAAEGDVEGSGTRGTASRAPKKMMRCSSTSTSSRA